MKKHLLQNLPNGVLLSSLTLIYPSPWPQSAGGQRRLTSMTCGNFANSAVRPKLFCPCPLPYADFGSARGLRAQEDKDGSHP